MQGAEVMKEAGDATEAEREEKHSSLSLHPTFQPPPVPPDMGTWHLNQLQRP